MYGAYDITEPLTAIGHSLLYQELKQEAPILEALLDKRVLPNPDTPWPVHTIKDASERYNAFLQEQQYSQEADKRYKKAADSNRNSAAWKYLNVIATRCEHFMEVLKALNRVFKSDFAAIKIQDLEKRCKDTMSLQSAKEAESNFRKIIDDYGETFKIFTRIETPINGWQKAFCDDVQKASYKGAREGSRLEVGNYLATPDNYYRTRKKNPKTDRKTIYDKNDKQLELLQKTLKSRKWGNLSAAIRYVIRLGCPESDTPFAFPSSASSADMCKIVAMFRSRYKTYCKAHGFEYPPVLADN